MWHHTSIMACQITANWPHDDVNKWKHCPRYWPFARGIPRLPVNSPRKGQWRGALMFSLICTWTSSWVNNGDAGDLRRHRSHYDVIVVQLDCFITCQLVQIFVISSMSWRDYAVMETNNSQTNTWWEDTRHLGLRNLRWLMNKYIPN